MMKRKTLVNLDHFIDVKLLKTAVKRRRRPIEILNAMLSLNECSPRRKRVTREPRRYSPQISSGKSLFGTGRKSVASGICPKCGVFVEGTEDDDGVVCVTCNAYWHFNCAEVSQQILDNEWKDIEFLCVNHRSTSESITNIKLNNYTLNVNEKLKSKLNNINGELTITERDGGCQYKINLNSTSYQLIVDNIWTIGNSLYKEWYVPS